MLIYLKYNFVRILILVILRVIIFLNSVEYFFFVLKLLGGGEVVFFVILCFSLCYMLVVMNFENKYILFFYCVGLDRGVKVVEGYKVSFCLEDIKCDFGFE